MRYSLVVLLFVLLTSACGKGGYTEVSLEHGALELQVPEEFSIRKDTSFTIDPVKAHEIRTFKFTSAKDSVSAVGVAYSRNANSSYTLDAFLAGMEAEAHRIPRVKMKGKETKDINGNQVGVLSYVVDTDTGEVDLSAVAFAILDKNIYTVNVSLKGKVEAGDEEKANTIINSFKIRR